MPIVEVFASQGKSHTITADQTQEQVYEAVQDVLNVDFKKINN